jgi:site-specific DNA recombinase
MDGNVPLGYDVKDRKLIVNEDEAAAVRLIFRIMPNSARSRCSKPSSMGYIVSKRREGAGGALSGGKRFSRSALYLMLQNRLYRGEVGHKGQVYPGQHEAIMGPELWQSVQDKLAASRRERSMAVGAESPSLLAGLIVDSDGDRMTPTHAIKKGKRYRYYVSTVLIAGSRAEHPKGRRAPAGAQNRTPPKSLSTPRGVGQLQIAVVTRHGPFALAFYVCPLQYGETLQCPKSSNPWLSRSPLRSAPADSAEPEFMIF